MTSSGEKVLTEACRGGCGFTFGPKGSSGLARPGPQRPAPQSVAVAPEFCLKKECARALAQQHAKISVEIRSSFALVEAVATGKVDSLAPITTLAR